MHDAIKMCKIEVHSVLNETYYDNYIKTWKFIIEGILVISKTNSSTFFSDFQAFNLDFNAF